MPPFFDVRPSAQPIAVAERLARMADPGFGRVFTDHMAVIRWSEADGWHDAHIAARAPLVMDPASSVFHYAQEIFEGMKAYRLADGGTALFRPTANARRFRDSASRMAMPELPEALFVEAIERLVAIDRDWVPASGVEGSLYLRPFQIASEVFLGVKPSTEYLFMVIASTVGAYWKGGERAISCWVSPDHTRAAPGGTGAAKCGGNYAASLLAQKEAIAQGCDQVVFLDAVERRWVEELGGMNLFFVFDDGSVATPPLTGTILPGITRDSLLTIARDLGVAVREERYAVDQWRADATSGRLAEAFACGTAAVVTTIGEVQDAQGRFTIGGGRAGPVTTALRDALLAIQRGVAADPHGWLHRL
ncbi:branched-chain amino acid aminotransferase [uncultured Sphingomonas sp.]|uniref:branched-chain amino acid aminotransferase n=1 Tax=uncultured Sphingomonas sp. TaxID=158754 RepID=UPI0035C9C20A